MVPSSATTSPVASARFQPDSAWRTAKHHLGAAVATRAAKTSAQPPTDTVTSPGATAPSAPTRSSVALAPPSKSSTVIVARPSGAPRGRQPRQTGAVSARRAWGQRAATGASSLAPTRSATKGRPPPAGGAAGKPVGVRAEAARVGAALLGGHLVRGVADVALDGAALVAVLGDPVAVLAGVALGKGAGVGQRGRWAG